MTLGEKLKQARLDAGLSQRQLCGDIITRNMLSQIENGSARPSMDTLQYLASRLGKTVSYFLEEQAVVSPNLEVMEQARNCHQAGDWNGCIAALEDYQSPDGVCDRERELLHNLSSLNLAEQALKEDKIPYARDLLDQVWEDGLYYPVVRQRHLLLLAKLGRKVILPDIDDELLLRAEVALKTEDMNRCSDLLQAVENKDSARWNYLKGEAFFGKKQYAQAVECYKKAEEIYGPRVWVQLESCCRELEDYKLAYEYACKQR